MCRYEHYRTRATAQTGAGLSLCVYRQEQFRLYHQFDKVLVFAYGLGENFSQYNTNLRLFAEHLTDLYRIPVVLFDYDGAGCSKIPFRDTSMETRAENARAVLGFVRKVCPLADILLCGHSAGGAIAAQLASEREMQAILSGVILTAPAAYHPEAWDKCFGDDFTAVLRAKRSWAYSLEFEHFGNFPREKGVIICEGDEVVPLDIPQEYLHYSKGVARHALLSVYPYGHKVFGSGQNALLYRQKTLMYADLVGQMAGAMVSQGPLKVVAGIEG